MTSVQYVLWRRFHSYGGNVKGFGFTLRGECDFKLDEFHSAPVEFFEPYYGLPLRRPGSDEEEEPNGDLTRPDNLEALQDVVMKGTGGKGLLSNARLKDKSCPLRFVVTCVGVV